MTRDEALEILQPSPQTTPNPVTTFKFAPATDGKPGAANSTVSVRF